MKIEILDFGMVMFYFLHVAEEWRTVPGFETYEVSDAGRVRHTVTKQIRALCYSKQRYARLGLRHKHRNHTMPVHKLVLLAFVGPSNGLHVNHKNFDRTDNRLLNLEYVTPAQNVWHAVEGGRRPRKHGKHLKICPSCGHNFR